MRIAVLLGITLALAVPTSARADDFLSKREARREALEFTAPFVDLLDVERTVPTRMVPPRKCRRTSHRTVTCRFSAYLESGDRMVHGSVRVHLQRDGLLGFLLRGLD